MSKTLWSSDTVRDVAESIGMSNLQDDLLQTLSADVEYRLHEVVQEAKKFMTHSKRTTLSTLDIDHALRVLNVEPLYGYSSSNRKISFKEASVSSGQPPVYYLEDDEVDFDRIVNQPLPRVPRHVTFTAHWLAIEGIQPAIPQNPSQAGTENGNNAEASKKNAPEVKPMVKHVLSKELQFYFEKIASALADETNESLRDGAINSLRTDPGIHQLLPYFVQLIAEKVTHYLKSVVTLTTMMHVTWALLENPNLFIEPYVQQLIPAVLTCMVAKNIGEENDLLDHYRVRDLATNVLALICNTYGTAYRTLKPRLCRTLLRIFLDNRKPLTSHYGAITGLTVLGPEVVRTLLVPNIKLYAENLLEPALDKSSGSPETEREAEKCIEALFVSFFIL